MALNTNKPKTVPTKPLLWKNIKKKHRATSEGSKPGRWSAQKSVRAQKEYEQRGGGWKKVLK